MLSNSPTVDGRVSIAPTVLDEEDEGRWYAVQCQPHRERAADLHLVNQNFRSFLPLRRKTRRHARKIESVLTPFFPGYLFLRLDVTRQQWRSVNGTFGVVRLVTQGDSPAPVPQGFVEALINACQESDVLPLQQQLLVGQSVRVLAGPFAECVGRLDRLDDTSRVRVLLEIMGGHVPISLPRDDVVAADSVL